MARSHEDEAAAQNREETGLPRCARRPAFLPKDYERTTLIDSPYSPAACLHALCGLSHFCTVRSCQMLHGSSPRLKSREATRVASKYFLPSLDIESRRGLSAHVEPHEPFHRVGRQAAGTMSGLVLVSSSPHRWHQVVSGTRPSNVCGAMRVCPRGLPMQP